MKLLAFRSGMSAKSDLRAAMDAHVPIGIVAGLVNGIRLLISLPQYMNHGGKVFVDSGAFRFFGTSEAPDWKAVFRDYETLLDMTDAPENLSIVAPDKVGDQAETLRLLAEHRERIRAWIDRGARVVVAIQLGAMAPKDMLEAIKATLGTDQFVAGIPSNKAPMSVADCATLRHGRFHFLGRVQPDAEHRERVAVMVANNPDAEFSADATWMRSRFDKIGQEVEAVREKIRDRAGADVGHLHIDHPRVTALRRMLVADRAWGHI